ncbi:GH1 family beta-glucosidase [Spirochaetia bacterium 38H-sp]|uniref:Beta-glucosidase n=1 Tax=Rarispira pelagica TaxID=3141764 RepID=A0ABU9UA02_9SPIR
MHKSFPDDFLWGVATASYQVEGATDVDGRSPSIWDTFSSTPGKVKFGHTGERSAQQYYKYKEDVRLMAELGVGSYRFSLSWPRIIPAKDGRVNQKGLDYYNRLIDELLSYGIKPNITLFHWDLPQYLEDDGGWLNRDTAYRFADYAKVCFDAFGDRVDMWATLNEPSVFTALGYGMGVHAPGKADWSLVPKVQHNLYLGHGLAVKAFRDGGYKGKIGIVQAIMTGRAATNREEDLEALDVYRDGARMYMDPLFGRGYPERLLKRHNITMDIENDDLEIISASLDYLGLNYYFEHVIKASADDPRGFTEAKTHYRRTAMGWPVVPQGLKRLLHWVNDNYSVKEIYITENGAAYNDVLAEDMESVHDEERIEYLKGHFKACAESVREGIPLKGYFLWSFIDNFEWAFGYTKRFGIVYCDYLDGRRVPKDSYYYYREVISGNEVF